MKIKSGATIHWLLFALGLVIAILWSVFCFNSEIDLTGDLVLSKFFLGESLPVWVFLGVGVVLFVIALGLSAGLVQFLELKRTMAYNDEEKAKKLNVLTVVVGLVLGIALIAMIAGAVAVLTSSGSDPNTPGTIYYYYY